MSHERESKPKEIREWVNLLLTFATPIILGWLIWSVRAQVSIARYETESAIDKKLAVQEQNFVPREAFQNFQQETNKRLDGIAGDVARIQQDVATIKGQLQVRRAVP